MTATGHWKVSLKEKNSEQVGCSQLLLQCSVPLNVSLIRLRLSRAWGLPRWLSRKESSSQCRTTGDVGSIPGSGRWPGVENGNPLQYSCLENPMDRGTWQVTVHEVTNEIQLKWLSLWLGWVIWLCKKKKKKKNLSCSVGARTGTLTINASSTSNQSNSEFVVENGLANASRS